MSTECLIGFLSVWYPILYLKPVYWLVTLTNINQSPVCVISVWTGTNAQQQDKDRLFIILKPGYSFIPVPSWGEAIPGPGKTGENTGLPPTGTPRWPVSIQFLWRNTRKENKRGFDQITYSQEMKFRGEKVHKNITPSDINSAKPSSGSFILIEGSTAHTGQIPLLVPHAHSRGVRTPTNTLLFKAGNGLSRVLKNIFNIPHICWEKLLRC